MVETRISSSFRDPSGFVFRRSGVLYRQINNAYRDDYRLLISSGLYECLVQDGLLVAHSETEVVPIVPEIAYKVIRPEPLPFISYPYEWSFSQLKDAALATLKIQKSALKYGLVLKDASAYNIQFRGSQPVLIDTLSFERYEEGRPWVAYRQFCQHFLAPLALMSLTDVRIGQMLRVHLDGIPLDLACRMLPWGSRLKLSLLIHLHLHAKSQKRYEDGVEHKRKAGHVNFSRQSMLGLIDHLEAAIQKLTWKPAGTEWGDYYHGTNYTEDTQDQKKALVTNFLAQINPKTVWDVGANTGRFSRLASSRGAVTMAFDVDPAAVEKNYREARGDADKNLLPLVMDMTNPSSAIGWASDERMSMSQRGPADVVMALAFIHHMVISNNVPMEMLAKFLSICGNNLIIEFVAKEDSQVQRLLATRKDIFDEYDMEHFKQEFSRYFMIQACEPIVGSCRTLFWMTRR